MAPWLRRCSKRLFSLTGTQCGRAQDSSHAKQHLGICCQEKGAETIFPSFQPTQRTNKGSPTRTARLDIRKLRPPVRRIPRFIRGGRRETSRAAIPRPVCGARRENEPRSSLFAVTPWPGHGETERRYLLCRISREVVDRNIEEAAEIACQQVGGGGRLDVVGLLTISCSSVPRSEQVSRRFDHSGNKRFSFEAWLLQHWKRYSGVSPAWASSSFGPKQPQI